MRALRDCLDDEDQIFTTPHRLTDADEGRYAEMDARFHRIIVNAVGCRVISQALERNSLIRFASPQPLACHGAGRHVDRMWRHLCPMKFA